MFKLDYSKKSLVSFLALLWQLPQTVLAVVMLPFVKRHIASWKNAKTGMTVIRVHTRYRACWSLGAFIFTHPFAGDDILKHETGHSAQSLMLGPLYLLVVGLPSALLFWIRKLRNKSLIWYNTKYPEDWANSLGGVKVAAEKDISLTQTFTVK